MTWVMLLGLPVVMTSCDLGFFDNPVSPDLKVLKPSITATGGQDAAGIGTGACVDGDSACGDITITAGVTQVTATRGADATNSIGAGVNGDCGTVTIDPAANVTQN